MRAAAGAGQPKLLLTQAVASSSLTINTVTVKTLDVTDQAKIGTAWAGERLQRLPASHCWWNAIRVPRTRPTMAGRMPWLPAPPACVMRLLGLSTACRGRGSTELRANWKHQLASRLSTWQFGVRWSMCCVLRQPSAPVDPPACSGP